ncbi:MAG TPA: prenyltransferase/squalene oxidase repeat-containing protein, partial [Lacipirellulaceae bacterium]|nr:prenyltransferase/squalene oxidase repeat-containing protein [Lacipirellulaceae bacterium]
MNLQVDVERLLLAHKAMRAELVSECAPGGYWTGQISSSAVATAAAVSALVVSHRQDSDDALRQAKAGDGQVIEQLVQGDLSELLVESLHWLARRQNEDGGWSDCEGAESNLAATMLVQAAFRLTGIPAKYADLMVRADDFVEQLGGVAGLRRSLPDDKVYLAATLTNCALADMISWRQVPTLPFEWLHLPKRWRSELQLPVPRHMAAIVMAVGLAKFHNDPSRNPLTRLVRRSLQKKTLAGLQRLQAADDSFMGSPLLTAFVVMSLADAGQQDHPAVQRGVEFLLSSVRADASWSVATNLATTNTVLALKSLTAEHYETTGDDGSSHGLSIWQGSGSAEDTVVDMPSTHVSSEHDQDSIQGAATRETIEIRARAIDWLLKTQRTNSSLVTDAPAGGWGAGDAPGTEPNTVVTAGALQALADAFRLNAAMPSAQIERAAGAGIGWLVEMQNDDGGWGTYCRDDNAEPGGSNVDATAQSLRALSAWQQLWKMESPRYSPAALSALIKQIAPAIDRGLTYLESQQNEDGSFSSLWFGNEHQANDDNPVMGTAQALAACAELGCLDSNTAQRAAAWMVASQHADGGWGPPRAPVDYSDNERNSNFRSWRENETLAKFCSVEETAAAVGALVPLAATSPVLERSVSRGLKWLTNAIEQDRHRQPAIIGFYLSRIWYYERLYPVAFAAGALSQALGKLATAGHVVGPVAANIAA